MTLKCGYCGDPTNELDGKYVDLGNGPVLVCPGCSGVVDELAGGDGASQGVSTKYVP